MTYPLESLHLGRADSLYGAVAKLVAAGVNISPIVDVSLHPSGVRHMDSSHVSFFYFMAPDDDPDVPEAVRGGVRRNVAHYCPGTGAVVIEAGLYGFGRDCDSEYRPQSIAYILLPMLATGIPGISLIKSALAHAETLSLENDGEYHVWIGYRVGRLHCYVTRAGEQPGPSDCKHFFYKRFVGGFWQ